MCKQSVLRAGVLVRCNGMPCAEEGEGGGGVIPSKPRSMC